MKWGFQAWPKGASIRANPVNPNKSASYSGDLSRDRGQSHGRLESRYDAALDVFKLAFDAATGRIPVSAAAKGLGHLGNVVLPF